MRTEKQIRQHLLDIAEDWDEENEYQEGRLAALDWVLDASEVGNVPEANACAQWFGEPMGHIDPVKAANAATIRIGNYTSTIQRETAEIGGEWDKNMAQIAIEREYIKGFTPSPAVVPTENKEEDDERSSEDNEQ